MLARGFLACAGWGCFYGTPGTGVGIETHGSLRWCQLGCPDPAPVHAIKVEKEHKTWCSPTPPTEFQQLPHLFDRVLVLLLLYSSCFFKPWIFFLCPRASGSGMG